MSTAAIHDVDIGEVKNPGDIENEYVVLQVKRDCDIGDYVLTDTTYDAHGTPSNKHRHVFFFPTHAVKRGDLVFVYSHAGRTEVVPVPGYNVNAHRFYWNLKETVWNKTGDAAYLLKSPRQLRQQKRVSAKV